MGRWQKFCRLTLFHQGNHLHKLSIKLDLKRRLEGHQVKRFSGKKFIHLIQPFIYNLSCNLSIIFNKSLSISYVFNLNMKHSCQTLSKTFEISTKVPLVSDGGLQQKLIISYVIVSNCATHVSPGMKPD